MNLHLSRLDSVLYTCNHYIKTVADVLLFCARQDIALSGHCENEFSSNRGNFLEILSFIAKHDKIVREKLQSGPKITMYIYIS